MSNNFHLLYILIKKKHLAILSICYTYWYKYILDWGNVNMEVKKESNSKYALIAVAMASFFTAFISSAINLALPAIGEEFHSNTYLLSWVATSYLLATAAFLVPVGRFADIVGRKKIFITGLIIFAISTLLCGLSWSIQFLLFFRLVQGIGAAMIFGTNMAILTSAFPPQERGKVLGISVSAVYIGLSIGPVLGGVMNHNFGWNSIFYFTGLATLVVAYIVITKLEGEWAGARGEKYDFIGAALYAIGLIAFMYGFSSISNNIYTKFILVFGLIILIIFIKYELSAKYPVLNLSLFTKNITFTFSNIAALINYSATSAVGFLMSLHLQVVMGFNSQVSGLILLTQPVLMALLSPFAGGLSDRIEPRILASLGMGMTTVGLFVFYFLGETTPLWLIVINLALLGVGFALFSSPNSNAIMGSVERKYYGVASSSLATMRLVGQAASMATVTLLLTLYVGHVEIAQASVVNLLRGTKISFIIFSIICLLGVFASLARGNINDKENKPA